MKTNQIKFAALALICLASLSVAVSCTKEEGRIDSENKKTTLRFKLSDINSELTATYTTKAAGKKHNNPAFDTLKNTLQFLVFNSNNQLEEYKSLSDEEILVADSLKLEVLEGTKQIWVVANSHDFTRLQNVKVAGELDTIYTSLENEEAGNFTMVGKVNNFVVDASKSPVVNVTLKRMVARVHVGSIKTQFSGGYASTPLTNVEVYMINYYWQASYGTMFGKKGSVLNADGVYNSDTKFMLMSNIDCVTLDEITSTPTDVNQYFYMYGNNLNEYKTKLIIKGKLADSTYYYPITIHDQNSSTKISPNMSLNIADITLTRPGVTDPSEDLEVGSVQYAISTENWIARDTSGIRF